MARLVSFLGGLLIAVIPASYVLVDQPQVGTSVQSFVSTLPEISLPSSDIVSIEVPEDWSVASLLETTRTQFTEIAQDIKKLDDFSLTESGFLKDSQSESLQDLVSPSYVKAQVDKLARAFGMSVVTTEFDESSGWWLLLESGEHVILGRRDIEPRLIRALTMATKFPDSELDTGRTIDARYVRGVAVSTVSNNMVATN